MKKLRLTAIPLCICALLAACGGGDAAVTNMPESTSEPPVTQASTSLPQPEPEPESVARPAPEAEESPAGPAYQMEYSLPRVWLEEYRFGARSLVLDTLPQTDAEAVVALYWHAEMNGEFIRHSYLWADGLEPHMQVMIGNAYGEREQNENTGFSRVQVLALREITREETLAAWNTAYDEPLLQHYYENARAVTGAQGEDGQEDYESYVAALYDAGYRVVYLKLDTEYFPEAALASPQYPDGEREMCYLVGPNDDGNPVLYDNSYGYSILMPSPGDAPLPVASTAP